MEIKVIEFGKAVNNLKFSTNKVLIYHYYIIHTLYYLSLVYVHKTICMIHREIKREKDVCKQTQREGKRHRNRRGGGREERFTYEKLAHYLMETEIFQKARKTRKLLVFFDLSSKSWPSDASVAQLLIQRCFPECGLALIAVCTESSDKSVPRWRIFCLFSSWPSLVSQWTILIWHFCFVHLCFIDIRHTDL